MNTDLRVVAIFSTGFLMMILLELLPAGNGRILIIEMLKIPLLVFLGIVFGTFYAVFNKTFTPKKRNKIFMGIIAFMILLNFLLFPYP